MRVKQAANVIEILEYFAARKRSATLSEIADDLGWPRSSTYNLVSTLTDEGYLYEPRTRGGYYPSPRWLSTAQTIADAEPLPEALHSMVTDIASETGETTTICAPAGSFVIMIYVRESSHSIRYYAQVGTRVPIYASSAGRAVLAQYSADERMSIYRKIRFEQYTETTPMSIDVLEDELRRARERGYHQSNSEFIPDLAGVSIALPLPHRRLSVTVAGPVSRCLDQRPAIGRILQASLQRFAGDLGLAPAL